ncbi:hypothetical protein FUT87_08770 [Mitsuaria sp. TWR114]|uniref:hypothetical protein n=1 Tax=Mitsuaria sp. TWR114 TaxID=2601731 RepID=UPI0011BE5418|nr:hypothetical protein [Mitsuaria sp. TWR114]TXD92570.1 hypothetical protein FUT87_08770 [Mitsuaria sp. TWR114]
MNDNWTADIEAELLRSGRYAPVLILVPPPEVGPPLRRILPGEYPSAEHAKLAALDAFAEMSRQ